jgi:hypothetical protein
MEQLVEQVIEQLVERETLSRRLRDGVSTKKVHKERRRRGSRRQPFSDIEDVTALRARLVAPRSSAGQYIGRSC